MDQGSSVATDQEYQKRLRSALRAHRMFGLVSLLVGIAVFVFTVSSSGLIWATLNGYLAAVVIRGACTHIRRSMITREKIADESDPEIRILETNRHIFWRRLYMLGAAYVLLMVGTAAFQWLTDNFPAAAALIGLVGTIAQFLIFMLANFAMLFGPFLLYSVMGRESILPGDANYDVHMEDIRGQKSAVEEMRKILRLIEQGRNYVKAGGKRERGVLFVGPPGTGKTMLAKAIASSLRMPIIITNGASFQGMFLGMDMVNVFLMVRAAKNLAKRWGGCAVFIDEIDALGSRRSGMGGMGGGMGGMFGGGGVLGLNMLLVQMDGMDKVGFFIKIGRYLVNHLADGLYIPHKVTIKGHHLSLRIPLLKAPNYNILFIGATNRPSVLDEALTRPGRFGRTITFRNPSFEDRLDIADLYFGKKKHDADLDSIERRQEFARVTDGYSPAMIEQATSIALMYAFEAGRDYFKWEDLREAMGNIEAGLAIPVQYTDRDKIAVARHELGHAVAARFFKPDHDHARLSIKMRQGSLGHHRTVEQEEQFVKFRSQMAGEVRHCLGAIASERVFYGENSSGVSGDLEQATRLVAVMVGIVGMGAEKMPADKLKLAMAIGDELISTAEMGGGLLEGGGLGPALSGPRGRKSAASILGSAYIDCWRLMYVNKEAIDAAVEVLIAKGELMGDEINQLLDSVHLRPVTDDVPYPEMPTEFPKDEPAPEAKAAA